MKGGKNGGKGAQACGPVKARFQRSRSRKTGSRGVPGRTPCSPHGAARYSVNALNRWRNLGKVQGVKYRNELRYSKESLACWLASAKGQAVAAPSQQHREWMKEFEQKDKTAAWS